MAHKKWLRKKTLLFVSETSLCKHEMYSSKESSFFDQKRQRASNASEDVLSFNKVKLLLVSLLGVCMNAHVHRQVRTQLLGVTFGQVLGLDDRPLCLLSYLQSHF